MASLAERIGLGRRQLERRFRFQEGIGPAAFRRRVRLQKSVRSLLLDPALSVLTVALDQGYYDQSHFHRDFQDITGRTLSYYLAAHREKTHFYNTPAP